MVLLTRLNWRRQRLRPGNGVTGSFLFWSASSRREKAYDSSVPMAASQLHGVIMWAAVVPAFISYAPPCVGVSGRPVD
jgi:hypothetical protein